MKLTGPQRRALEWFADGEPHSPDWLVKQMGYKGGRAYLPAANLVRILGLAGFLGGYYDFLPELQPIGEWVPRSRDYSITLAGRAALEEQP